MPILRSGRQRLLSRGLLLAACVAAAGVVTYAASTSFWLVSTQTDFLKGEVEQLSVDSDGRVMLGPAVDTLHETATPAVWRLAIDSEGAVWAGTGNEGKVIKVEPGGKASVVFDANELEIHAIAPAAGGVIYAGSSPDGKVYKITKDGKTAPFFDPEDKYIWTLLPAPDGTLYAGTGEKGRVYKIGADGTGKVFYESGTTHITALAWDGKGALLVGTSSPGRVVRVDPTNGRGFVLLESAYKEVRSIKVSSVGHDLRHRGRRRLRHVERARGQALVERYDVGDADRERVDGSDHHGDWRSDDRHAVERKRAQRIAQRHGERRGLSHRTGWRLG